MAASNIFLFTGENAFALRQERHRWIHEFDAKHGAENRLSLDGSRLSFRALLDETGTSPFIGGRRLVVVQGVPRFSKEEMQVLFQSLHPDCILLFSDPAPDKRLGGLKLLLTVATVKEFGPVSGRMLTDWMKKEASALGKTLEPAAADLLLTIVGENQDLLAEEIRKLSLAATDAITPAHVQMLAVPSGDQEVWQLTNYLSRGDVPGALLYAKALMRSGEDPHSLWNILLWLLRSLVTVSLCVAEGERNPAKIATAGVPFPTAKMLVPLAQKMSVVQVRSLLDWAVRADRDLKTGGYKATTEAQQELIALIDAFIVRCGA